MVLVNIIHILYTNSIHVPYNIRGHFNLYSLQLLYNVLILIIHVAHKIYRTFGN